MEQETILSNQPKMRNINGIAEVYDPIRKKYLLLTPEEWVRQNCVQYFTNFLKIPSYSINLEYGLKLNGLSKRIDILVRNSQGKSILLVECKAENVPITQEVIYQASRYNLVSKAPLLMVTNGKTSFYFKINFEKNDVENLSELPKWNELKEIVL